MSGQVVVINQANLVMDIPCNLFIYYDHQFFHAAIDNDGWTDECVGILMNLRTLSS
jgi:hypothetical protein